MKVLIDMNLSPRWATVLREAGIAAEHWSRLGGTNASDSEIMAFARYNGHVVLTHDLDFSAILAATGGGGPSVVQIRSANVDPDVMGSRVLAALTQIGDAIALGALVTINPQRTRIRILPLNVRR